MDKDLLEELGLSYEDVLNVTGNGVMGYIEIPKISVSLVIYHSIEEDVLQKGIGHAPETDLPIGGSSTHCVLAGHTGLPSAKLLTNIDQLMVGDRFYIHVLNEVLEYKVDDVSIVEPHEVSRLSVISQKDCVTLVTCTPYGVNSHRLLVRGVRVDDSDLSAKEDDVTNELRKVDMKYVLTFSLIGLGIIFLAVKKLWYRCLFSAANFRLQSSCLPNSSMSIDAISIASSSATDWKRGVVVGVMSV
jgi:sortase A